MVLLYLASAAKWLGPAGLRVFAACRDLKEMRPPQTTLQFLVIYHDFEPMSFFEFGDSNGRGVALYWAFRRGLWEAICHAFPEGATCTHAVLQFEGGFRNDNMSFRAPRRVELGINGVRTITFNPARLRSGLRHVNCDFGRGYVDIVVRSPTRTFIPRGRYIARVGRNQVHVMLCTIVPSNVSSGPFAWTYTFYFCSGDWSLKAVTRLAVAEGPRHYEVL